MSELSGDYAVCRDRLLERLKEPAPGRIQLLTGPRQVGKTTLLLDLAAQFGDAADRPFGARFGVSTATTPGVQQKMWDMLSPWGEG